MARRAGRSHWLRYFSPLIRSQLTTLFVVVEGANEARRVKVPSRQQIKKENTIR